MAHVSSADGDTCILVGGRINNSSRKIKIKKEKKRGRVDGCVGGGVMGRCKMRTRLLHGRRRSEYMQLGW